MNPQGIYFVNEEEAKRYGESFDIPTTLLHYSPKFTEGNLEQKAEEAISIKHKEIKRRYNLSLIKKFLITTAVLTGLWYGAKETGIITRVKDFVYDKRNEISRTIPKKETKQLKKKRSAAEKQKNLEGMVYVPAGEFIMGSDMGYIDEKPAHKVYLDSYYIDKYEVTFDKYDKFCEATGREKPSDKNGGRGNRPAINVSWKDAVTYAKWAGKRLPTEAEWEKACRAGSTGKWCFGDNESEVENYAWYRGNSDNKTHPVGEKKPNAWKIYDMYGNVWEWCSDWYDEGYYKNSPYKNPKGPDSGEGRAVRGGSWDDIAVVCRPAIRIKIMSDPGLINIGFRCAYSGAQSNGENAQIGEGKKTADNKREIQIEQEVEIGRQKEAEVERIRENERGMEEEKLQKEEETERLSSKLQELFKNKEDCLEEIEIQQKSLSGQSSDFYYKGQINYYKEALKNINNQIDEIRKNNYNAYEKGKDFYEEYKSRCGN